MMKKLILITAMLTMAMGLAQNNFWRIAAQQGGGFLPHPNAGNPNPELVVNDAASFTSEINGFNASHSEIGSTLSAESDLSNGYGQYVVRITPTATGTTIRDRHSIPGLINGEIYQVYLLARQNNTTGNGKHRMSTGSSDGDHQLVYAAHTDWVLYNWEFTHSGTGGRIDIFARENVSVLTEWTEYKLSVKQKND